MLCRHQDKKIAVEPAEESSDTDDDSLSDASADNNVTQDSRDVLVQRLTDLAARLSGANVRTAGIEALHRQVDEMERVLVRGAGAGGSSSSRRGSSSLLRHRSLQLPDGGSVNVGDGGEGAGMGMGRDALGVMAPMNPSWLMSHFQRRPSVHLETQAEEPAVEEVADSPAGAEGLGISDSGLPKEDESLRPVETPPAQLRRPCLNRLASLDSSTTAPRISSQVAEDAIKEAENLCAEMAMVITSLQTRREESDVIPSL